MVSECLHPALGAKKGGKNEWERTATARGRNYRAKS